MGPLSGNSPATSGEPILTLQNVAVRYGPTMALDNIDLAVRPRERIAFVGASGSGKTTLLSVVSGLRQVSKGSVSRKPNLRMGLILQDPVASLNPRWTVEQIVAEPIGDAGFRPGGMERQVAVRRALGEVGLARIGLHRSPAELSVGQCQRVALARALAASPDLLLADEPTSALDPSVAAGVLRLLDSVLSTSGAALLIVSHDVLAVAPLVTRLVVLEEGRIVDDGPPTQLLEQPRHAATARLAETARRLAVASHVAS